MNQDFRDMLAALGAAEARFLIVGAHALAAHGIPRATGDLDLWIDTAPDNIERVWRALDEFGAPVEALGVTRHDLSTPEQVIQLGLPPRRIDLLTSLGGLDFSSAWSDRIELQIDDLTVPCIDRAGLVASKRAAGRTKDLADLEALGETV